VLSEVEFSGNRPVYPDSLLGRHRSSIARMICSAQRTASPIAVIVAGTRFPPSNCASFRYGEQLLSQP
jgi:hypothetical protein